MSPAAAGVIHSDFEKFFIRAKVVANADYVTCNGIAGARDKGVFFEKGKDYVVQDGDVLDIVHGA